jgi:hypothetical protein
MTSKTRMTWMMRRGIDPGVPREKQSRRKATASEEEEE